MPRPLTEEAATSEMFRKQGLSPANPGMPPRVTAVGIGSPYQDISSPISNHVLSRMTGVEDPIDFSAALQGRHTDSSLGDMLARSRQNMLNASQNRIRGSLRDTAISNGRNLR